jgi:hypothetical protein
VCELITVPTWEVGVGMQFGCLVVVPPSGLRPIIKNSVIIDTDDLCGVESLLAHAVRRVVEETRQLAERLDLEVVLLILLLALLGLVLELVQPVVDGVLQVSMAVSMADVHVDVDGSFLLKAEVCQLGWL